LVRFLGFLKPYRHLVLLATLCGVVRYLIPLVLPWTLKLLVDDFLLSQRRPRAELHIIMLGLVGLYLLYAVASYWRSYLAGLAGHRLIFDLRMSLYQHLQRMSLSFFDRQKVGEVVARMTGDIASAQNFVGAAFVNTVMDLAAVTAIVGVLLLWHWKLALAALAVFPFYAWVSGALNRRIREKSRAIHDQLQELSGEVHENFAAISTIQAFNREEAEIQDFRVRSERFLDTVLSNVRLQSVALGATGFLTAIGPILVLWFGATEVWAGRLSVGTLMAFYATLGLLYQPVQRLAELNLILTNSLAAMDRIFEVFDTYPEVDDRPGARDLGRARGEIAFESVTFGYDPARPVLQGFDLRIEPGETVALVGPSGAGKSTIAKLAVRFYDVQSGRVLVDGIDVRDVTLRSLRRNVAVVAQEPILLSGTVLDNLRLGRPDASWEEIERASRLAQAHQFIQRLPRGYETELGERGARLSGGERQRLAIARAILRDAPIVILDEPTSALDSESEGLIREALRALLDGRTAIVIAHRLTTVQDADRVVVVDRGRIVEEGRHEDLLRRADSLYRRYALQQLALAAVA
jgi:subfamily B ATP-binding cassette protein MsbA